MLSHLGFWLERAEAERESVRDEELSALPGAHRCADPFAVGRRTPTDIDSDGEGSAAGDAHQLGSRRRRALEVEAPDGPFLRRGRIVLLYRIECDPKRGKEILAKYLLEASPFVPECRVSDQNDVRYGKFFV